MKKAIAILIVIVLVITAVAVFCTPNGEKLPVSWTTDHSSSIYKLDYTVGSTSYSKDLNILLQSTDGTWDGNITILIDRSPYISSLEANGSNPTDVQGLYDHLKAVLVKSNVESHVTLLEMDALSSFFDGAATTLVISNDIRADAALAQKCYDWVQRGGCLVAIGNHSIPFAFQDQAEKDSYGREGIVLGYLFQTYDSGSSVESSAYTDAYGLQYWAPYTLLRNADVLANNGTLIGFNYPAKGGMSTIASIPIGNGTVLAFSGSMSPTFRINGEDVVAEDLAKLLMGGAAYATAEPVYISLDLGKEGTTGSLVIVPSGSHLVALAFTNDKYNTLLTRELVL